jgi:hypothetical protein
MAMPSAVTRRSSIVAAILLTASALSVLAQPAGAQQTRLVKVSLASLTAQGFEVKAAAGNQAGVIQTLVLQKGEQVFFCDSKDLSVEATAFECWQVK